MKPPFIGLGVCITGLVFVLTCGVLLRAGSVTLLLSKLWLQDGAVVTEAMSCNDALPTLLRGNFFNLPMTISNLK